MKLKQLDILNMFIDNPSNEREVGYNTALVNVLRLENGLTVSNKVEDMLEGFSAKLRKSMPEYAWSLLDRKKVEEIKSFALGNQKLNAVKLLKEYTGLGLKEAKDAIDGACSIL